MDGILDWNGMLFVNMADGTKSGQQAEANANIVDNNTLKQGNSPPHGLALGPLKGKGF